MSCCRCSARYRFLCRKQQGTTITRRFAPEQGPGVLHHAGVTLALVMQGVNQVLSVYAARSYCDNRIGLERNPTVMTEPIHTSPPIQQTGREAHAASAADASSIGCDKSFNLLLDTLCPDSIHLGAAFRSSSGRFIVNAAVSRC